MRKGLSVTSLLPFLDLVAVAIAADIVPMTGENRVLSYFGLGVINDNPRPGLKALMGSIQRDSYKVSDLVFQLAPRINAAGRMEHGQLAVRLLTEQDASLARKQANAIESLNEERRGMDRQITEEALELIRENREENRMSTVDDHFLKIGVNLLINNHSDTEIRNTMEREVMLRVISSNFSLNVLKTIARLTPSFGLAGTVISLIKMFNHLDSIDSIAPMMAVALMSTFYGVIIANLFMMPLNAKLKERAILSEASMNSIHY